MRRKIIDCDFDQMYEGMLMKFDEGQEIEFMCCDCSLVHHVKIKILGSVKGKRKLVFDMRRNVEETNKMRSQGSVEIEDGYKVKVTKVYETKKEKINHENNKFRFKR
jgi:hypothetical protein